MIAETFHGLCPIVELRQYSLVPDQRDVLVELFEREFVESQETLGMRVIGQFRDLDDPDRFVWLRGFASMKERHSGLSAFYGGPVWGANRNMANATMLDSDNVLLLRPARVDSAFNVDNQRAEGRPIDLGGEGFVVATIVSTPSSDHVEAVAEVFERTIAPALIQAGATVLGYFETEPRENTFPALPVREGEHVFASFAGTSERAQLDGLGDLAGAWTAEVAALVAPPEVRRLHPTSRSSLTGTSAACGAALRLFPAIDGHS